MATQTKTSFKFKIGQTLKYIGEEANLKGKEYIVESREQVKTFLRKSYNVYTVKKANSSQVAMRVTEELLKTIVANPEGKKFITKIDERAKQIQKQSGVLKTERVTFYNISRSKAKEQAFQELKK